MPSVVKSYKRFIDSIRAIRAIRHADRLPYYAEQLSAEDRLLARKMLAKAYLERGGITKSALNPDGTLNKFNDPYQARSYYFGVKDARDRARLLMAARLIVPENGDISTLQLHLEDLSPEGRRRMNEAGGRNMAEFASFVKDPSVRGAESGVASLFLMRSMLDASLAMGIKTWVFGIRPEIATKYYKLFGPVMESLGEGVHLGHFTTTVFIPYMVDVNSAVARLQKKGHLSFAGRRAIAKFMAGSDRAQRYPKGNVSHTA